MLFRSLCPIEHGAGTRIKLWASLAAGLPSVAFPESLRGTDLRHGEHLLVAEKSAAGLLAALEQLAGDAGLAHRLAAEGRALVVERHDWRLSAARLEAALQEVLEWRETTARRTLGSSS